METMPLRAALLALATALTAVGCAEGDAPPDPDAASGFLDASGAPDGNASIRRPDAMTSVDAAIAAADAGSSDGPGAPRDAALAEAAPPGACAQPAPDPAWMRPYEDDLVASLAGAKPLPGGQTLGRRQTADSRTATRQFLIDRFREIGLTAQLHAYGSGQNVYAELRASEPSPSAQTVILGAHFDTVAVSPGANDNATGVAAVLAVARYLGSLGCRTRNVLFVLFDQEESGLVGSQAFARKLKADGTRVHSVHTIDQLGWDMDGDRRVEVELPDRGLREMYVAAAADLGRDAPDRAVVATNTASTDHASFRPDFPAIGLTEEYRGGDTTPHYHRSTDTYETVNFDYLASSTVLVARVFADLVARTPVFADRFGAPIPIRRSPAEMDREARRFSETPHPDDDRTGPRSTSRGR